MERVARAIAQANGDDDWHAVPKNKSDWVEHHGEFNGRFRDVNEPYQNDYLDMAEVAIAAYQMAQEEIESTPAMISAPDLVSQVEKMIAESEREGDETLRELAARIVALISSANYKVT